MFIILKKEKTLFAYLIAITRFLKNSLHSIQLVWIFFQTDFHQFKWRYLMYRASFYESMRTKYNLSGTSLLSPIFYLDLFLLGPLHFTTSSCLHFCPFCLILFLPLYVFLCPLFQSLFAAHFPLTLLHSESLTELFSCFLFTSLL